MSSTIILAGHCGPDSSYLRMTLSKAVKSARIISADDDAELMQALRGGADLLLLNREMPYGFMDTQGVNMIPPLKQAYPKLKIMLISNYSEAQEAAVAAGGLPGFGKREMGSARVTQLLRDALEPAPAEASGEAGPMQNAGRNT
jgi:CheY-like chemotaxis protein